MMPIPKFDYAGPIAAEPEQEAPVTKQDVVNNASRPYPIREEDNLNDSLWPDMVRIAGGLGGSAIGFAMGGPPGAIAGGAIGSGGADIIAQMMEMDDGSRPEFRPQLTLLETVLGAVPGFGKTPARAALSAAAFGVGSMAAREAAEGRELPPAAQLALGGAVSGVIGGGLSKLTGRLARNAAEELTGDSAVGRAIEREFDPTRPYTDPEMVAAAANLGARWDPKTNRFRKLNGNAFVKNPFRDMKGKVTPADVEAEVIEPTMDVHELLQTEGLPKIARKLPPQMDIPYGQTRGELDQVKSTRRGVTSKRLAVIRKWLPNAQVFARLQKATGAPFYDDYTTIRTLYGHFQTDLNEAAKPLKSIFRGTRAAERVRLSMAIRADPNIRGQLMDLADFSPAERTKVEQLSRFYDKYSSKFGITPSELGELFNHETDELLRSASFVRKAAYHHYLGESVSNAERKYRHAFKGDLEARDQMLTFLSAVRGEPSKEIQKVSAALTEFFKMFGVSDEFAGRAGDMQQIASDIVSFQYMNALGLRPATLIRNTFQPIQTMTALAGARYTAKGLKKALTKLGVEEADRAGVLRGQAIDLAEVQQIAALPHSRLVHGAARKALYPFQRTEEFVRTWAYQTFKLKYTDAFNKTGSNWERFVDASDIDRMQDAPRELVQRIFASGNPAGAIDLAAQLQVMNTQFDYSIIARPQAITQGPWGRVMGGFTTWPLSYTAYLADNFASGAGPKKKIYRDLSRFVAANAAIGTLFAGIGAQLGDEDAVQDALGFTGIAPAILTETPGIQVLRSSLEAAQQLATGRPDRAMQEFRRAGMTPWIPFGGALQDINKIQQEALPERKVGRALGFVRGQTPTEFQSMDYRMDKLRRLREQRIKNR